MIILLDMCVYCVFSNICSNVNAFSSVVIVNSNYNNLLSLTEIKLK